MLNSRNCLNVSLILVTELSPFVLSANSARLMSALEILMNENIKIDYSFIIPAYNEEAYLPKTLASLKNAMNALGGFRGEIVVTNNNSTDRTAAIAEESGARVIFEKHRQISRARNAGAQEALGRYLIFIDSDTTISPVLLKKTLTALGPGDCCGGGTIAKFDGHLPFWAKFALKVWVFLSRPSNGPAVHMFFVLVRHL